MKSDVTQGVCSIIERHGMKTISEPTHEITIALII